MIDPCCTHSYVANSEVTEPNPTKFLHDVAVSSLLLMRAFTWRYCSYFWSAIEITGETMDFGFKTVKWQYLSNILCKFDEVR